MSSAFGGRFADLHAAGLYLPGLLIFYLYLATKDPKYLVLFALSLLGAITVHGMIRSVFGPEGPEQNPLPESTGFQRVLVLMLKVGPARKFPHLKKDIFLNSLAYMQMISWRRRAFLVVMMIATLGWIVSVLFSLVEIPAHLNAQEISIAVIYFAYLVWILQNFVIWGRFPPVHYMEEYPDIGYDSGPPAIPGKNPTHLFPIVRQIGCQWRM